MPRTNFLGGVLFSIGVGDVLGDWIGEAVEGDVGVLIADGDGAEFGDAVGDATGFGLADGDGVLDGDAIADGVGDAVGDGVGDFINDGFGARVGAKSFVRFLMSCEFAIGNWFCLAGSFLGIFCDITFWLIIFFSKSLPLIRVDFCGIFCELEFLFLSDWELLFLVNLSLELFTFVNL